MWGRAGDRARNRPAMNEPQYIGSGSIARGFAPIVQKNNFPCKNAPPAETVTICTLWRRGCLASFSYFATCYSNVHYENKTRIRAHGMRVAFNESSARGTTKLLPGAHDEPHLQ